MRWRASLSDFLRELGMPVVQQVLLSSNPDNALANALGTVRSATLRKHFREARRIKAYSKATSDSNWPQHVGVILSYLERAAMRTMWSISARCYLAVSSFH